MPDDWESDYGLNPYDATDAARDTDVDGFTNIYEYQAGTDPLDVMSSPPAVKRWFESFELGIPADAKTEPSTDGQIWTASGSGTDGEKSAVSPVPNFQTPKSLTFSRYFEAGQLSADLLVLEDPSYHEGQADVLIDGNVVATYYSSFTGNDPQGHWHHFSRDLIAGIHTIEFRISGTAYVPSPSFPFPLPRLQIDSIRFMWNGDSDNDGLADRWEFEHSLNADDTDSDHDGLPDGWEVGNALDPLTASDLDDADGDGASNLEEYRLHTDPHHSDSTPSGTDNTTPPTNGNSDGGGSGGGGTTGFLLVILAVIVSWRRKALIAS